MVGDDASATIPCAGAVAGGATNTAPLSDQKLVQGRYLFESNVSRMLAFRNSGILKGSPSGASHTAGKNGMIGRTKCNVDWVCRGSMKAHVD